MTIARRTGDKTKYKIRDKDCLARECFKPGRYEHRGATGTGGSRSTGHYTDCCVCRAYHGCPNYVEVDAQVLARRKLEGWKTQ